MISAWQTAAVAAPGLLALAAALIALAAARQALAESRSVARTLGASVRREGAIGQVEREHVAHDTVPTIRRIDPPQAVPGPLIAVPSLATVGAEGRAREASDSLARRFGAIWDLADSGHSPAEIARDQGQPIGQVELVLALRRPADARGQGGGGPHG